MGLAERFGCSAEAVRFRCPDSSWLGEVISGMSMAHWLAIFAIPSAILGAIGLLISLILKVKRSDANPSVVPRAAFYRSRHKVFAGVCYALARLWNLPILGVRIVTVILAIVIPGFIFLYFWCWLAFPIEPQSQQPVTIMIRKGHQNPHHPCGAVSLPPLPNGFSHYVAAILVCAFRGSEASRARCSRLGRRQPK
jgi:phage shock protein PspC (stress-responsive transcriptional regulator)